MEWYRIEKILETGEISKSSVTTAMFGPHIRNHLASNQAKNNQLIKIVTFCCDIKVDYEIVKVENQIFVFEC